jgi:hypothetical protein
MQHGIPEGSTIDLPISQVDEESKTREKQMAAFTEKEEWKILKKILEAKIAFHQKFLPNGTPITDIPVEELGPRWIAANIIIDEFNSIINEYEGVAESVRTQTS